MVGGRTWCYNNVGGVTAGQAPHNSINVGVVTAGETGHSSDISNANITQNTRFMDSFWKRVIYPYLCTESLIISPGARMCWAIICIFRCRGGINIADITAKLGGTAIIKGGRVSLQKSRGGDSDEVPVDDAEDPGNEAQHMLPVRVVLHIADSISSAAESFSN